MGWLQRLKARRLQKQLEKIDGGGFVATPKDLLRYIHPAGQKAVSLVDVRSAWGTDQPVWTDWTLENAVEAGMYVCSWVFACVYRRAKSVASVPWFVEVQTRGGSWQRTEEHDLAGLIENPNPYWSRQDLMERMVMHLDLAGNALLNKNRIGNGKIQELWLISPDLQRPVRGPKGGEYIKYYETKDRDGRVIEHTPPEDVCHLMNVDPNNDLWGMSLVKAAGRTVDTDVEAVKWNKLGMQNRGVPDGVFTFAGSMSQTAFDKAKEKIEEQAQGYSSARKVWILGNDAKFQQMSLAPVQMDFIPSRMFTREEICAVFGTPPPMIGIYDKATLANIETSRVIYWVDTIIPQLEDVHCGLNRSVAPEYGEGVRLMYDVSSVPALLPLLRYKVDLAKDFFSLGYPMNVINERLSLGMPEIPSGNVGYLPGNLLPSGGFLALGGPEEEE